MIFNTITLVYAIVTAFNFFLGTSILLDNPKEITNRYFFFFIITGMGWVVSLYYFYQFTDPLLVNMLGKVNFAFVILVAYVLYKFVQSFLSLQNSRLDTFFLSETLLLTAITITTPLIDKNELIVGLERSTQFGVLYFLFAIHAIFYFAYATWLLCSNIYRSIKAHDDKIRQGKKYLALGLFSTVFLVTLTNIILPYLFNYTGLQDYAPIYTVLLFGLSAYAIGKHHLFNLKVISTEIFTFALWFFVYIRFLLSDNIFDIFTNLSLLVLIIVIGMILIRSVIKEVEQREKIQSLATDLQKANDRLKELDRQKSEFVSFATHQLRAPLTAMKGYASLILEGDLGALSQEIRSAITRIYDSSNTLTSIVDDYLNISRIELGSMKYSFEMIDLKELVEDVVGELRPSISKSKLNFTVEMDEKRRYLVNADSDKFKQIIANLIDNSIKYTPSGSVTVSLTKKIEKEANKIIFSVKDTGIGIAPEVMPKLFLKFSRAENGNRQNIHGTGLGLYVAKEIVNAHSGRIWAESAGEGKGSAFFVELDEVI